MIEEN
jgi:sodium-coupled neutral amino acid transporter 9